MLLGAGAALLAGPAGAALKINEVYYQVTPHGGNQYVELYNAGSSNAYLDGMILTDEGASGIEGVYQWPGVPGETNYLVLPAATVLVAVDATGATINADWECYGGGSDTDNPSVSNLTLVGGVDDLDLSTATGLPGDNVILGTGASTNAPIAPATIVDGMNYASGGGELAMLSSVASDADGNETSASSASLSRCPDGNDSDVSSTIDFLSRVITADSTNACDVPTFNITDATVTEGGAGTATNAIFFVTLNATSALPISVTYFTSNGTAVANGDYTSKPPTLLTFSAGVTTQTITVVVNGDVTIESNETFTVRLNSPTNATIADAQGLGTIVEDDAPPPPTIIFTSTFTRISGSEGAITSEWTAVSGAFFRLQASTNITMDVWTNVSSIITATAPAVTSVDAVGAATITNRIYRVINLY